ncbi:hypothetical protein EV182_003212 [Spiromyces aspiralis]|uniref:Uncharacterized protein n=1 Tax=Spiromyces aspiralis TaxID=68401 RepID=A0ACC1HH90_9FUNG|nr:hypothetical protein EV182_003212 [Spiromyces aspiralis]
MVGIDPVNLGSSGGKINNCTWHPLYKHSDRSREDASLYQFAFGFTEEEVGALIGRVADKMGLVEGQADKLRGVARKWYGGYYACKGVPLYNPWSIMSYIKDITKSRETCLEAVESGSVSRYWLSTGHTMALAKFFRKAGGIRCWILEIWKFVVDFLNLVNAANGSVPNYEPQIRFCMVYNPRAIKNPEDVLAKMQWRFITGAGVDQCVVSIADSVEIMSAIDSLNVREFMTMLYHRGCLSVKDGAYLMIPNYEVLCAWLDSIGLDRLADRLVSGVSGRPVLVDHLLSGEYPEFIEHVERVLEAQGREITAWMPKYFYQGLLSMMLSLFLDSSKYDIAHKVSIDIGRPTVVVKPRLGATDDGTTEGSGRESVGVLIEIKQASPWTVDKDARTLTADDARFIEDEAKDRTERARRKLGDKTFESLKGLLATGYDRALKKYLNTFNECCDEVLVIVASFSGKHCLFRFEYFKRTRVAWSLDPERHPVVDDLACPYNWPGL